LIRGGRGCSSSTAQQALAGPTGATSRPHADPPPQVHKVGNTERRPARHGAAHVASGELDHAGKAEKLIQRPAKSDAAAVSMICLE
jgi:hypothetical protein